MDVKRETLDRLENGDPSALNELLACHRPRLRKMICLRMDRRLAGRFDASDVIQDAFLEAARRLPQYLDNERRMPFFVWLRFIVGERLLQLHRKHIGTAKRDANRDVSIFQHAMPGASTALLAARLVGKITTPSQAAIRAEHRHELEKTLLGMSDLDREIITLRHLEELSRSEAAHALGISESACGKRYVRALRRLGNELSRAMEKRGECERERPR